MMSRSTRRAFFGIVALLTLMVTLMVTGIGGGGGHVLLNAGFFRPAVTNNWWWNSRGMTLEQIVVSNHNSHDVTAVAALNGIPADPGMVINGCIALRAEGLLHKSQDQGVDSAGCSNSPKRKAGQTTTVVVQQCKWTTNANEIRRQTLLGNGSLDKRLMDIMKMHPNEVQWYNGAKNGSPVVVGVPMHNIVRMYADPRTLPQIDGLLVFHGEYVREPRNGSRAPFEGWVTWALLTKAQATPPASIEYHQLNFCSGDNTGVNPKRDFPWWGDFDPTFKP